MAVKKVTVKFEADTSDLNKVDAAFTKLNKQAKKSRGLLKDLESQKAALQIRQSFAKSEKQLKKFNKQIQKTENEIRRLGNLGKKTGSIFRGVGGSILAGLSVVAIVSFGKHLNSTALRMEAFEKRAKTVFGKSITFVEEFGKANAKALGLTVNQFLGATAAIGDILVPLGFARQRSAEMSTELVKLGGALKEFTGDQRSASEISNIVAKSLTGEVEGLKGLGVVINQNDKDFKALVRSKIVDLGLTEQQAKAEAIFETVLSRSSDALKQFETNEESLTRQQAELTANLTEITETLATGLTPAFLTASKAANDFFKSFRSNEAIKLQVQLDALAAAAKEDVVEFEAFVDKLKDAGASTKDLIGISERFLQVDKDRLKQLQDLGGEETQQIRLLKGRIKAIQGFVEASKEVSKVTVDQIENVFFLTNSIKSLTAERGKSTTTLLRVAEINKELIPLQDRLNILLDKNTKKTEKNTKVQKDHLNEMERLLITAQQLQNTTEDPPIIFDDSMTQSQIDNIADINSAVTDMVATIASGTGALLVDSLRANLDERATLLQEDAELEFERINEEGERKLLALEERQARGTVSEKMAADQRMLIEDSTASAISKRESELAEELSSIKRKQAVADKLGAIFDIGVSTAIAIAKAVALSVGTGGLPFSAIAGAIGAAQIAFVAAAPLPQFAKGTKDAQGGLSIVGEQGQEAMFVPQHAKILPAPQTKKYADVFESMRNNTFDSVYIERGKGTADNMAANLEINGFKYDDHRLRKDVKSTNKQSVHNTHLIVKAIKDSLSDSDYIKKRSW